MITLPFDVLLIILKKIDFKNLIKLRSVCKEWKFIIDNYIRINELTIYSNYDESVSNEENIFFLDQFKSSIKNIFNKITGSKILQNLKYLYYSFDYDLGNSKNLIHLNNFRILERLKLEIEFLDECYELKLVHLNLKYLLVSINDEIRDLCIEVNCPKLKELELRGHVGLSCYNVIYPEEIKVLKLCYVDLEGEAIIDKFINIEYLEINYIREYEINLRHLNKLNKIVIKSNALKDFINQGYYYSILDIRNLLFDLIDQNQNLNLKKQIFLCNKELKNNKQIKKLIDKEIGRSLDYLISLEDNSDLFSNLYDSPEFSDTD